MLRPLFFTNHAFPLSLAYYNQPVTTVLRRVANLTVSNKLAIRGTGALSGDLASIIHADGVICIIIKSHEHRSTVLASRSCISWSDPALAANTIACTAPQVQMHRHVGHRAAVGVDDGSRDDAVLPRSLGSCQ